MITDVFIRTYSNDLEWLMYSLKSIHKHLKGFRKIIICIPMNQKHLLDNYNLTAETIVTCPTYKDDYLGQQISKLLSFEHTDADRLLFMDSDCMFLRDVHIDEMLVDGKPIVYKTIYGKLEGAECWKAVTEKFLNIPIEFEYMRRHPFLYNASTLKNINDLVPVEKYIVEQPYKSFSEFNVMGAYAERYENDSYHFIDTEKNILPEPFLKQYWSWSGLTKEERKELDLI